MKYVLRDKDRHGNERFYFRRDRTKPMVRLHGEPGSEEFLIAYSNALAGQTNTKAKTLPKESLEWLIRKYYSSAEFEALDPTTQRTRRGILKSVCDKHGDKPYLRLEGRHVRALRDEKKATPEAANVRLKALKQVFKYAVENDLIKANPASDVKKLKGKAGGFHSWTPEEIEKFEKLFPKGTKPRLAMALLLYTAQRRSDVVLMGPKYIRDGWLTLTQQKNRNINPTTISIPVISELQDIISVSPSGKETFLITDYGKPFTSAGFGNWFRSRCNEAGLPGCSAHGLRKAAAAQLAEKGCSATEIMAITGHRSLSETQKYVAAANQKIMAQAAMMKMEK